jgi:hypothetical protein
MPTRSGTVVVIADRSRSMPAESDITELHAINLLLNHIGKSNRLGVVSFGMLPFPERVPTEFSTVELNQFKYAGSTDASNLHDAIEHALKLIPTGEKSRLLVISDGRWTGESPDQLISRLTQRGIPVDFRIVERSYVGDIAILAIDAPEKVLPEEIFKVSGTVYVPVAQKVEYELTCNGTKAAKGIRQMDAGSNKIEFMLKAGVPGTMQCDLQVKGVVETVNENSGEGNDNIDNIDKNNTNNSEPKKIIQKGTFGNDPVPENNFARRLVGVEGDKPLLVLVPQSVDGKTNTTPNSKFAEILRNVSMNVDVSDGVGINWSLSVLNRYSGIIIENAPSSQIGVSGMELIRAWVKETGAGLMFTGGKNAYALGGYYKSPFDPIMPVSMEIRKEHRKLAIAVAVLMDCSGSMGMEVPGGKMKMDLADAGAAEVLKILSPIDEVAVFTCDTGVQTIVPLKHNDSPKSDIARILAVGPGGGGIFVYKGLQATSAELSKATAETKHIILFTDADDTEQPESYVKLLTACREVGMTCSVIALGTRQGRTADLCVDIAKVGGGNIYFTEKAEELPRLFAQDTFTISRSTFLEDATAFKFSGGMLTLSNVIFRNPPALGGYNLCYLKNKAVLSAVTEDDYTAPIIASWQAGLGRVLCYTGQVDGKFTGEIAGWENYNAMLASLGRWTAGKTNQLPDNMMLTQSIENGGCEVRLHLDPEGENTIATTPEVTILVEKEDGTTETRKHTLKWLEPDLLGVTVPLAGDEIVQVTLLLSDGKEVKPYSLPPVCIPNSPEFKPPDQSRNSGAMLRQIAAATGGVERIELPGIWRDIPKTPRSFDMSTWLIYLAIFCITAEIFQRRTGLITVLAKRIVARLKRKTIIVERNKDENKTTEPDADNQNVENDAGTEKDKVLSFFSRLKLRRKAREIIKPETNNNDLTTPAEQPEQIKTQKNENEQQSNVLEAINKAKQSAKPRTGK